MQPAAAIIDLIGHPRCERNPAPAPAVARDVVRQTDVVQTVRRTPTQRIHLKSLDQGEA